MAFLTINGNTYQVNNDGTQAMTPVTIGEKTRAFAGGGRSTVQTVKREWTFTSSEYDAATYNALIADAAASNGMPACGGDGIFGGPFPCFVLITGDVPLYDGSTWKANITINVCQV